MKKQRCPHLSEVVDIRKANASCADCDFAGPNLWVCMQRKCLNVGCSEQNEDHSTLHYQRNNAHCVHMNLSSQRLWCYKCEREVFLHERNNVEQQNQTMNENLDDSNEKQEQFGGIASTTTTTINTNTRCMTGLVGLKNIANTCYMNSAVQALSNVRPMTYYFLNCGDLVTHAVEQSVAAHRTKAGLAKSYQHLMYDIWLNNDENKDCITPRSILFGIRSVHPMFRGFQQHDTQEFLRCFMDQLHEELKEQEPIIKPILRSQDIEQVDLNDISSSSSLNSRCSSSLSMSEYETCESSPSSDDLPPNSSYIAKPLKRPSLHSEREQRSHTLNSHSSSQSTKTTKTSASSSTSTPPSPQARSIISDIFDGKLLSSVQCLTCDRISTREETFQDLSLPIPNRDYLNVLHQTHSASAQSLNLIDNSAKYGSEGWISWLWGIIRSWLWGPSVTLHDCMASFFSADELKGDNMYSCEKCNKLRTGLKYSQILDLPEVLCIHLKRFRHDLSYSSKISSHVHFPLEGFDMRPYLHKDCASNISLYNLSSIICHHGTVGGGHYTCMARNVFTNRWYEFDDHRVSEVSAETVQNCQAYVLFYQKHNPQIELIRAEANELSATNPVRTADIRFYISREWLVRFNTFAEPGPIDNWSMLCPHGGILQSKIDILSRIAIPISQPLWDFLYCKYGGGPAINVLFECEICLRAAEELAQRRLYELNSFTKYNSVESSAIFAISMSWLRKWQQFVRGTTNIEPGPITNNNVAAASNEASTTTCQTQSTLIQNVRPGSDYAQLNAPQWRLLYQIYGGGPEILLRGSLTNEDAQMPDFAVHEFDENLRDESRSNVASPPSDTESNIADTQLEDHTASIRHVDMVTDQNAAASYETDTGNSGSRHSDHSKTSSRHSSSAYHVGYNKIKPKANTFRKRNKKSRNAINNSDFFGPRGHYNLNGTTSENAFTNKGPTQRYETHSNEDGERSDSGVSVNQSLNVMPGEKRHSRKHFGKIPLSRSSNKINKTKSKESVTLKKFVTLNDSNESLETDV